MTLKSVLQAHEILKLIKWLYKTACGVQEKGLNTQTKLRSAEREKKV